MAVMQPLGFNIDFVRNSISGSAAWFFVIILIIIFTSIFKIKISRKISWHQNNCIFEGPPAWEVRSSMALFLLKTYGEFKISHWIIFNVLFHHISTFCIKYPLLAHFCYPNFSSNFFNAFQALDIYKKLNLKKVSSESSWVGVLWQENVSTIGSEFLKLILIFYRKRWVQRERMKVWCPFPKALRLV